MNSNKKFVVEANFIEEAYNLKLTLPEFLLLIYFENSDDYILDFDKASSKLKIAKESILESFNSLLSKNIISLISEKNIEGKIYDKVSLDNFYNKINENKKNEDNNKLKDDIFSTFEREFGRPLRGMEFEIIKAWLEKLYSEDLILRALEEAVLSGAPNIRYIDTILHEWNKKGLKTKEDVDNYFKNKTTNKNIDESILGDIEFDWLNEYER